MAIGGMSKTAAKLQDQGRYGDTHLVHMSGEELALMEHLNGAPLSRNPQTGYPEMFSLGKLLGGIGAGIAGGLALFTGVGAAAAPYLFSLAGGLAGSAFAPDGSGSMAEADAALAKKNLAAAQTMHKFPGQGTAYTQIYGNQQPNILGKENNMAIPGNVTPAPVPGAADGGSLSTKLEPEEKATHRVALAAAEAILGKSKNPQKALNDFVAMFGKPALEKLKAEMSAVDSQQAAAPQQAGGLPNPSSGPPASSPDTPEGYERGGLIHGPGGGLDDLAPAKTTSGRKLLVSDGEYVVPADVVGGLAGGSNKAGARILDAMMERVRVDAHGHPEQIKKVNLSKVLPA